MQTEKQSRTSKTTRPIRLLYVLDYIRSAAGGTESQFLALLKGLDRSKFSPSVVLLRGEDIVSPKVPDVPVEVLGVGSLRSRKFFQCALRIAKRVRHEKFEIAHLFFNDVAMSFPPFLRIAGAKVIVSRRDLGFWYTPLNLRWLRLMRPAVNAVLCNSEAVKRAVIKAERYPEHRVTVINNGFDKEKYSPIGREAARLQLGIEIGRPVITMVANLRPLKRFDDAIRAIAVLKREFPHILLQIVGADSRDAAGQSVESQLKKLAAELDASHSVRFLGSQKNPMPYIEASNACLLCSETEGLSNSIIEYMWAGRAVVCTNVGGNPELIKDGETGYVVPVGDINLIADRLRSILMNPYSDAMGQQAREKALRSFSPDAMVTQHQIFYSEILKNQIARK